MKTTLQQETNAQSAIRDGAMLALPVPEENSVEEYVFKEPQTRRTRALSRTGHPVSDGSAVTHLPETSRPLPSRQESLRSSPESVAELTIGTELLRRQRLDSFGMLAGGILHDVNNCLAPALASMDLIRQAADRAERERYIALVESSVDKAVAMVRQALDFARGARGRPETVSISHLVRDMASIIRETFPKAIQVEVLLPSEALWPVQSVAIELYQVLLNLCVNARDAMPAGGKIHLSAQNAVRCPTVEPGGQWVKMSVSDTGGGIPADVLPRIFEPFFTTKAASKGTGLGLFTVAELIQRQQGVIDVKTKIGCGTEFEVYLPAGGETVLAG